MNSHALLSSGRAVFLARTRLGTRSHLVREWGPRPVCFHGGVESTQFCHHQNFRSRLGFSLGATLVPFPFSAGLEPWSSFQPPAHICHFCLADQILLGLWA